MIKLRPAGWRRPLCALLAAVFGLALSAVAQVTPAGASPQCPQYTIEPCDDGGGEPGAPPEPPMETFPMVPKMGEMIPTPTETEPNRACRTVEHTEMVYEVPTRRLEYVWPINLTICITPLQISLLSASAVPQKAQPEDERLFLGNRSATAVPSEFRVIVRLRVTFCPDPDFCQVYEHRVFFDVSQWNTITVTGQLVWLN